MTEFSLSSLTRPREWTVGHATGIIAIVLLVAPFVLGSYQTYLLTDILLLGLFATAFNLLYGYTGLLSFGHAMFFAGSGYTVAIFLSRGTGFLSGLGGISPVAGLVIAVLLGVVVATVLAVPVGFVSVRLDEIYFAMITLSFSMALYTAVLQDYGGLTNGSNGISVILQSATFLGMELPLMNRTVYYFLVLAVFAVSMYALWRIVRSPFGTALKAVRENPERAAAVGMNVSRLRWVSFVISAAFSGLAGALYVPLHSVASPDLVHWSFSAEPVIMTVLGGPYSFVGPVFGAAVYRYLRWLVTQNAFLQAHWQLVFGVLVVVVLLFFDRGISGLVDIARNHISNRLSDSEGDQ